MAIDEAALQALIDKLAIQEVLVRYTRAIDRHDEDLLRGVYWPGAYDDHVLYEGDIEGLIAFNAAFVIDMPTQHFIGNCLIELDGPDRAFAETYFQAYHNMPIAGSDRREDLTLLGRYLDDFEKRDCEWRIMRRVVVADAYTLVPATSDWRAGPLATARQRGGPKPDDPLYRLHPAGRAA